MAYRFSLLLPVLLLLFPYLPAGLRAEYLVVAVLLIPLLFFAKFRINYYILILSVCLLIPLLPLGLVSLQLIETGLFASPFTMMSRLALPGMMLICFSLILSVGKLSFGQVIESIIMVASIIAAISIFSFLIPGVNDLLFPWVSGDSDGVWYQSTSIGRMVGIFNQPLEAGLFFAVAFCAIIIRFRIKGSSTLIYVSFFLIIFAGILTLSKVFLVLGIVFGFFLAFVLDLISWRRILVLCALILLIPFFIFFLAPAYAESLMQLYRDNGWLFALTAGRLGAPSENTDLYVRLFNDFNWVVGFGLGSQLPLDSGYLEYFYQGGILSVIPYVLFIGLVFCIAWMRRDSIQGKLLFFLGLFLVFASLGGPVVSAGRANIAFILLVAAAIVTRQVVSDVETR